jgi:hypothetical protein
MYEARGSVIGLFLVWQIVSTHLPPLSLSVMVLEQALIEWNSVLAIDKAKGGVKLVNIADIEDVRLKCCLVLVGLQKLSEERTGRTHPH